MPFGLAVVPDVYRVKRRSSELHVLGLTRVGLVLHELVVPVIPGFDHRHLIAGAADDHHVLDGRRAFAGLVDAALEGHEATAAPAFIGGDDRDRGRVVHAVADRLGAEPAEDHRVGGSDPGAGEHRHRQLGNHRHVDPDPVTPLDAELPKGVGQPADPGEQLRIGDGAGVALLTLEVICDLFAATSLDVAIQTVV